MQLAKFLSLFCLLLSCEQRTNFALRTSVGGELTEIDTLELTKTIDGFLSTYNIGSDQLEYSINFSDPNNATYSVNSQQQSFDLTDTVSIYLNTNELKIYRFNSNFESFDGEQYHFFTVEHGLLMIRNPTWGNSTILELWSYPILEQMNIFRPEPTELSESDLELFEQLDVETTETKR